MEAYLSIESFVWGISYNLHRTNFVTMLPEEHYNNGNITVVVFRAYTVTVLPSRITEPDRQPFDLSLFITSLVLIYLEDQSFP